MIVGGVYPGLYGLSGLLAPPLPLPPESVTSCTVKVRYCVTFASLDVEDMQYCSFTTIDVRDRVMASMLVVTQGVPCGLTTITVRNSVTCDCIDVTVRQLVTATVVEGKRP